MDLRLAGVANQPNVLRCAVPGASLRRAAIAGVLSTPNFDGYPSLGLTKVSRKLAKIVLLVQSTNQPTQPNLQNHRTPAMTFPLQSVYDWYRKTISHPKYRWWMIAGTLVYLLNPFDLLPDMIPLIGQIDDALLVTLLVTEVAQVLRDRLQTKKEQPTNPQTTTAESDPVTVDATVV
jgi:uncharacterized membrane protein YkvA (DUF1232 family)